MTNWKPPVDHTISAIDTTIERPNEDKVVITHKRYYDPSSPSVDEYLDWKEVNTVVRKDGEMVLHVHTETYVAHKDMWRVKDDYSHSYDLADDNVTIPFSGKEWDTHAIEHSRKCTNLRWKSLRKNKPDPKDAKEIVKEQIEANY
jgi:superfamily II RNA helicase